MGRTTRSGSKNGWIWLGSVVVFVTCLTQIMLLHRFEELEKRSCPLCRRPLRVHVAPGIPSTAEVTIATDASIPVHPAGCRSHFQWSSLPPMERSLLLFSAPSPNDEEVSHQLLQWKGFLRNRGTLVVFVREGQGELYQSQGIPTVCVDHTDEGLPRFDHMMRKMGQLQEAPSGIVAFVNADIGTDDSSVARLHDFLTNWLPQKSLEVLAAPEKVYTSYHKTGRFTRYWFAVSTRTDIALNGTETPHTAGGYDLWAWNVGEKPLLPIDIPPFRYPLANYDNFLLDMVVQASERMAIDMSEIARLVHTEHRRVGNSTTWPEALKTGVSGLYVNKHLSYTRKLTSDRGRLWTFGTPLCTPYFVSTAESNAREQASRPHNETGEDYELVHRTYWSNVPQQSVPQCENADCKESRRVVRNTKKGYSVVKNLPNLDTEDAEGALWTKVVNNWRYDQKRQLQTHSKDGTVILTAANSAYRDHLRNFKCNMDNIGAGSDWVVAALDEETYRWGVLQGFPIFPVIFENQDTDTEGGFFSKGFASVTKMKSAAVLEVLNLGFSVLFSDADISWFEHPLVALGSYLDDGDLVIQSNAPFVRNSSALAMPHPSVDPVKTSNPAGRRRLNSGLYLARNTPLVRQAFKEIVEHARMSQYTEQPSFDEVLCSSGTSERYYDHCLYRRKRGTLKVTMLDRFQFPNGAVLVSEDNRNVFELGTDFTKHTEVPLLAAHNNWIVGIQQKRERQMAAGWWYADGLDFCLDPAYDFKYA